MAATLNTDQLQQMLKDFARGDARAQQQLVEAHYQDWLQMARPIAERNGTMVATVLVNELYMRLAQAGTIDIKSREHFKHLARQMMRHILLDYFRKRTAARRDARMTVPLDEWSLIDPNRTLDFLAAHTAMEKLKDLSPRQAEVIDRRVFGGESVAEVAEALSLTKDRVIKDFVQGRAKLYELIEGGMPDKRLPE